MKTLLALFVLVASSAPAALPCATNWLKLEVAPMYCPGQTENGVPFKETHIGAQPQLLPMWGETVYQGITNGLTLSSLTPTLITEFTNNCGTNTHAQYAYAHARWPEVCQFHLSSWKGLWWRLTLSQTTAIPNETCQRSYHATNTVSAERVGGYYAVILASGGSCLTELGALTATTVQEYRFNQIDFPDAPPPKKHPWLYVPPPPEKPIVGGVSFGEGELKIVAVTMPHTSLVVASAGSLDATNWAFETTFTTDTNGIGVAEGLTDYGAAGFYRVTCYTNAP